MEKIKKEDMHRADIVALVRKSGTSISALSVKAGLRPTTLNNALERRYPKGEKIIADAVGLTPEDIWPSRYL
ncbi:transcriptional regulator [Pasteurella multocida]|uniref:helix-turn-helix domain-containing protein n=1 Tax=Pasteurella multocida TaxID=747 RepID=UPI000354080D|nr:helix-turn-helix domain-containing protein [Pasteurella multocida]AWW56563.1 transcriptional regulator [Pasteurella multocida]EPE68064.1 DNA-binding protein [Pasteurella multocida P1933]MCL7838012.1 helix-turn-helix domain-containing protein [Pasteurella multocida]MCL7843487.1 helix-turn-helix domain-containing protein [Pasteurella multocida]MDX3887930.1 helix-turn-helix domain-containing protein [Pasteurella multocida]